MKLLHGWDPPFDDRGGYVAIGNFDGVHRGHQAMLAKLVERACADDAPAVVVTFDPHPVRLLRPEHAPPNLTTLDRKAELLADCGVDVAIVVPTTREFLSSTPQEFFEQIIQQRLDARGVVEGVNFRFGRGRAGDVKLLQSLCEANGLSCDVVEPVAVDGRVVSSSTIRERISAGNVHEAVAMLGRPYRLEGTVAKGAGRGASLGFPTANVDGVETLLPADGVYAGVASMENRRFPAAVNLGPNPTFGDMRRKLEVHVLGFTGDLYGRPLAVDLYRRVRDVIDFDGPPALQRQLNADVDAVRRILADVDALPNDA